MFLVKTEYPVNQTCAWKWCENILGKVEEVKE